MRINVWVALDVDSLRATETLLAAISPHRQVKIGMELFYRLGPDYVRQLAGQGYEIFLDLKCHDIPRTVARAVRAVADLGARLLTVHVAGGVPMLRDARQAAGAVELIGVTVLTSLDEWELARVGIRGGVNQLVADAVDACRTTDLAGVVCAGDEVRVVRAIWPQARVVVPGIRLNGQEPGDQRRIMSPARAYTLGATDLVVGRPVVQASDPATALRRIWADLEGAVGNSDDTRI